MKCDHNLIKLIYDPSVRFSLVFFPNFPLMSFHISPTFLGKCARNNNIIIGKLTFRIFQRELRPKSRIPFIKQIAVN